MVSCIMDKLNKIREIVKNETEEDYWKYHIAPVVKYAKKLAKILNVDEEITELAALIHDIGKSKFGSKDHEITGIKEAEKILKQNNYPEDIIKEVLHCIRTHRGKEDFPPKTIIAKIIANADAMSHIDVLPFHFYFNTKFKKYSFEKIFNLVYDKYKRHWNKKITLPEARKMMQEKYRAIRLVLDSTKEYL